MLPYIIIFLFLLLLATCELFFKTERRVIFFLYIIFSIWIILFLGFRQCGFDYDNYYLYFSDLNSTYWKNNSDVLGSEKGYALLNYLIGDYRKLLIFMASITVSLLFSFFYKYSPYVYLSLFLFFCVSFYPMVMGQYRQALAVSIILWAFIKKRNLLIFFLLVVIATTFHVSAILAILAIIVPNRSLKAKYYFILLILALLFSEFGQDFFLNTILGGSDFIVRKVLIYTESEAGTRLGLNTAMLLKIIFFCIFFKNRESISSYSNGIYFLNLYFLGLLIYLGLGFFPQLAGRGCIYFNIFEFILPAMMISKLSKQHQIIYFIFFVCVSLYRYQTFLRDWYSDYVPYSWGISYL